MEQPHVVVLFGATGDLSRRKLLPGLLHLYEAGLLRDVACHRAGPLALRQTNGRSARGSRTPAGTPHRRTRRVYFTARFSIGS